MIDRIAKCIILALFIFLGAIGCKPLHEGPTDSEIQLAEDQEAIEKYLADNAFSAEKTEAGFYKNALVSNPGGDIIVVNDIVSIYYELSVLEGSTLQSVQSPALPLHILFGQGQIRPQSFEWGLTEMRNGETYEFYFPSSFAYNDYEYQNLIPAHAILKLVMQVIRVDDLASFQAFEKNRILQYIEEEGYDNTVELEEGVHYVQLTAGQGDPPTNFLDITADYTGTLLDGFEFDSSIESGEPITFSLGAGQVIEGWDIGFQDLPVGEKGLLFIPSRAAYGVNFFIAPPEIVPDVINKGLFQPYPFQIPPYATLIFEVEVLNIE